MIILSPAKRLSAKHPGLVPFQTIPRFKVETEAIVKELRKRNVDELMDLMRISSKLAQENYVRFSVWQWSEAISSTSLPALMAYDGDAYNALKAWDFNQDMMLKSQSGLRIISALYGILRPFDLIMPYRLEMQAPLSIKGKGNLYEFWGKKIAKVLIDDMAEQNDSLLINLASQEYSNSILPFLPKKIRVVTPVFYQLVNGRLQFSALYAKQARGMMTRFVFENSIEDPEYLVAFQDGDYQIDQSQSSNERLVFYR